MIANFINLGDRVDIQLVEATKEDNFGESNQTFQSKVHNVSEEGVEITIPLEKTKLVLLPTDREYNLIFYTKNGLMQCFSRITNRFKNNNVFLMSMELTSNLRKYQRREYYRFSCALEMCSRALTEEEKKALEYNQSDILKEGELPLKHCVIVDISGGGLRFISTSQYEPKTLLYCSYNLFVNGEWKKYEMVGEVLGVQVNENRPDAFEHRVKFINVDEREREEVIKYIFEEERKILKKKEK